MPNDGGGKKAMQALSKSDEQRLLDGVKMAVDLVDNQGLSPNAALQKVAEQLNYSPGFLKSACSAFNTGRQLAQWNENQSVLDKLASFPLADYDTIHDTMWGKSQEKVAQVSALPPRLPSYDDAVKQELLNYDLNTFIKAASAEVDPLIADEHAGIRIKRAFAAFDYHRRLAEEARRQKQAAEDQLNLKLHLLENYFRKFAYDRLPLAQVEHATSIRFGETGRQLINYVAERFPKEKRASDHRPSWGGFQAPVSYNQEPYTLIEAIIKQAQELYRAQQSFVAADAKLAAARDVYESFTQPLHLSTIGSPAALTPSLLSDAGEKTAFDPGSAMTGFAVPKMLSEYAGKGQEKAVENQINELDSPEHLNELRKIKAQTVLTQLMSDPDNPISGYDPEEVLSAYNEMVQLSPRLADQPSAIGPLLNKRLVGNVEPFEVGETLKLEKGLKDTQAAPSYTDVMRNEASIIS